VLSFKNGTSETPMSTYNKRKPLNDSHLHTNEESSLEFFNLNRLISEADIQKNPTLLLEEIDGDILRNNKLMINAGGLLTGARNIKDGVAFFGTKLKNVQSYIFN
jgi:hypothetical protein